MAANTPPSPRVIAWPGAEPLDQRAIGARLEAQFDRLGRVFAAATRRTRRLEDPEAIHDLRVSIRRLLALIRLWRPLLRRRSSRAAERALVRLRRRLGRVRELEVQARLLGGHMAALPFAARGEAMSLLSALESDRDRRREIASRRVRKSRMAKILSWLDRASHDMGVRLLERPQLLDRAESCVAARERDAKRSLSVALATGDDLALHASRVALKKWRYLLECHATAHEREVPLAPIRRLQEALGAWNDEVGLRAAIGDALERREAPALAPLLADADAKRAVLLEALPELVARALPPQTIAPESRPL